MAGWWGTKVRQTIRHATGRVSASEREGLKDWLSEPQLTLFAVMHPADQRHGLDVVARLRADGHEADRELLLAGLFHDCAKGRALGLPQRVAWALGERYGDGVLTLVSRLPGFETAFAALREHPEVSARLALAAGCTSRTADLIRHQSAPRDPVAGVALRLADEAS